MFRNYHTRIHVEFVALSDASYVLQKDQNTVWIEVKLVQGTSS